MFQNFLARLKEPSSWAALAAGLGVFGVQIPSTTWQSIAVAGAGVAALAGVFVPEQPKT